MTVRMQLAAMTVCVIHPSRGKKVVKLIFLELGLLEDETALLKDS